MARDPITGACETGAQTQTGAARPRPEMEEHFQSGGGKVSQQAEKAKENVKQKAKETADRMSATVDEAGRQMRHQAGESTRRLKEQGQTAFSQQKVRVAEEIEHFGAAAHEAANKLEQEDDRNVAHYLHLAADQLDGAARYVRESDMNRLMDDAGRMARRRPEVFFGGMFLAGITLARFLKASSRPRRHKEFGGDRSYWDEELSEFEHAGATVGASTAMPETLDESREGTLRGDIAGRTGTSAVPAGTTTLGAAPVEPAYGPTETPEKKHGDKLGEDAGHCGPESCPPGSTGKEVL